MKTPRPLLLALCLSALPAAYAQESTTSTLSTEQDARRIQAEREARERVATSSSVTLYGQIDTGVEYLTNVGPSRDSLVRMPTTSGSQPSRWGVRGQEDLGGGLRAIFLLESGFAADAGTFQQGGRGFGRQSFVGLSGAWGTLTLGRQYTMLFWSLLDGELMGPSIYGLGSLDSYVPNARIDNSLVYRHTVDKLTFGATYSLGRDTVNAGPSPAGTNCAGENGADKSACREWSAMVKYDTKDWGLALASDTIRGGAGGFAGLVRSDLSDTRVSFNGYMKLGPVKLTAGLIRRDNEGSPLAARSDLWQVGAQYVMDKIVLEGAFYRLDFKSTSNRANLGVLKATYNLSKRTALYATAGHISNNGSLALSVSGGGVGSNPIAGSSQTGAMVGMRHTF